MDNYKIAIINDKIDKIGDTSVEDSMHIQVLIDYIKEHYKENKMFDILNIRHSPEIAAYLISRLGNIVFLNITKDVKKYGKTGIFIMPDEIDDGLKEKVIDFSRSIDDYSVTIFYDLDIKEGVLDSKNSSSIEFNNPKELLVDFFDRNNNVAKKHQ